MARIVIRDGPHAGASFALTKASMTIGRDESSDIRLPDARVSRFHAELRAIPSGGYLLIDLGSSNGTLVGGKQIKETLLAGGDEIAVGDSVLVFAEEDVAQHAPDTEVAEPLGGRFERLADGEEMTLLGPAISEEEAAGAAPEDEGAPWNLARANRALVLLLDLARSATEARSVDEVFSRVGSRLAEAVGADRFFPIFEEEGKFTPWRRGAATRHGKKLPPGLARAPISSSIVEQVRRERAPVLGSTAVEKILREAP